MTMDRVYNPHQHGFQQSQINPQQPQLHRHLHPIPTRLTPIPCEDEPEQIQIRNNHHIILPQHNNLSHHSSYHHQVPQHNLPLHNHQVPSQCISQQQQMSSVHRHTAAVNHQQQVANRPPALHRPAHPPPPPPVSNQRYSPVDINAVVPQPAVSMTQAPTHSRLDYKNSQPKSSSQQPVHHYANAQYQTYQSHNLQNHCKPPDSANITTCENPPQLNGRRRAVANGAVVADVGDGYNGNQDHYTEEVIQAILAAKEALEKPIEERDDRDIMLIDNLCSLVHGFDAFPKSVRRSLAAQSVLIVIDERGKELIVHNEELDSFCVLIFGECEQLDASKNISIRNYLVGDAFGVCEPTTDTIRFNGHMITRCENCAFLCVKRDDFYTILTDPANYPHEETIRHRDKDGNVVCVSQFNIERKTSAPLWSHHMQSNNPFKIILPDGHIIVKATEPCLLMALVDGYDRIDPDYVEDFLLLFRVFMTHDQRDKDKKLPPGMIQLCLTLTKWLENVNYRDKVVKIVLTWLSSYYHDFELNPEFSYLYFKVLESRLLNLSMNNQLHLLHVTLSTKSKIRHVTITRSSREQPLTFAISGGYEKNCGIFVTQIYGSNCEECPDDSLRNYLRYPTSSMENLRLGPTVPPRSRTIQNLDMKAPVPLRPGDQILEVNGTNFSAIKLVEAQKKLDMSTHLSLTVKYNPSAFYEMKALPEGRRKSSMSSISSVSPFLPTNSSSKFTFSQFDQLGNKLSTDPYPPASPLFSANSNFGFRSMIKSAPKNDKSRLTTLINSSKQFVKQIRDSTVQVANNNLETMSKTSDNVSDDQSNELEINKAKSNPDLLNFKAKDRPIESNLSSIVRLDDINAATITENAANANDQALINVLKVYNAANNEFRYLLIHEETTAREVVMVAVKEFNLTGSSGPISPPSEKTVSSLNWHLYEVSVVPESRTIKQKCLSEQTSHLAERASLCSRFYIKNNAQSSFGQSKLDMDDDALVNEILKESPANITLTSLDPILLAVELTLVDFDKFRRIEPQQFVYDTFFDYSEKNQTSSGSSSTFDKASLKSSSSDGQDPDLLHTLNKSRSIPKCWMQEYQDFADISNKEMFWVVCEILNEKNMSERVKIIKQFIRVAFVCERLRNYNSMFAIISGLGHSCVNRLKRTFDKLKTDYKRDLDTMRNLFDPSRNMLNYRNCLHQTPPPAIPLFPQIKKDLTFTKEGRSIFVRESNDNSDSEDRQDTIKRKGRGDLLSVKSATVGNFQEDKFQNDFQSTRSFTFTPFCNKASSFDSDNVLVNFAEVRQFTERVRNVIYFSSFPYTKDLLTNTKDSQRNQTQIKKMHEEWQMRKRIRHYLSETLTNVNPNTDAKIAVDQTDSGTQKQNGRGKGKLNITYDERTLYQRSLEVEPELNARTTTTSSQAATTERLVISTNSQTVASSSTQQQVPPSTLAPMHPPSVANSSPTLSKSSSLSSCSSFSHHLPNYHGPRANLSSSVGKFGTESTESLRKLRALSENVDEWRSFNNGNTNSTLTDRAKGLVVSKILPPKTGR